MRMSFEAYRKYCQQMRDEMGLPSESEAALQKSYRAYRGAIELAGRDVDIKYERQPDRSVKQIFVPRRARAS